MRKQKEQPIPPEFEPKLSPKEYSDILEKLELRGISIDDLEASVDRKAISNAKELPVEIAESSSYEVDNNFIVHAELRAVCKLGRDECFRIKAVYSLVFDANAVICDDFFEIFRVLNLPLTIWPFFRELVNSTTSRMGIPALTLPLQRTHAIADE